MTTRIDRMGRGGGFGSTAAVNLSNIGMGVVSGVLTARGLGPSDRGVLIAMVLWTNQIASIALAGKDEAVIQRSAGRGDVARGLSSRLLARSMPILILGMVVLFGILYVVVSQTWQPTLWILLGLLALTLVIPLNATTLLHMASLRSAERLKEWNLLRLTPQVVYVAALLVLVLIDALSIVLALSFLVAGVALTTLLTRRRVNATPGNYHPADTETQDANRLGWAMLAATLPYLVLQRLDQLLLGVAFAPELLGVYAVGASLAVLVQVVGTTLEQVLFPRLVARPDAHGQTNSVLLWAWLGTALMALPLALAARPVITAVYGEEYSSAAAPLNILLVATVIRVGGSVIRSSIKAIGRIRILFIANVLGLVAVGVSFFPAVSIWGLRGAATATSIGAIIEVGYLYIAWRKLISTTLIGARGE